jgi:hypothetical protein
VKPSCVGKKIYDKNPSMHIQNSDLSCEKTVKLLDIEIDYELNFDVHVSRQSIVICIVI